MTTPGSGATPSSGHLPQPAGNWPAAETVPRQPRAATPPPATAPAGGPPPPAAAPAAPSSGSTARGIRRRPAPAPASEVDDATRPRQTPPAAPPRPAPPAASAPQLHTISPATPPGGAPLATPPPLTPAGGAPLGACPPPGGPVTGSLPTVTAGPPAPPPTIGVPSWSMSAGPGDAPHTPPGGTDAAEPPSTPPWLDIVGTVSPETPATDDDFRVEDAVSPYRGATNPHGTALPRALAAARRKNVLVVGACLLVLGVGIGSTLGAYLFSEPNEATVAATGAPGASAPADAGTEEVLAAAPELATPQETAGRHDNRTAMAEAEDADAQGEQIPADAFLPVDPATLPTQVPGLEFEPSPPYTYWTKTNDPLLISSFDASAAEVAAARNSSANVVDFSGGFCGEVAGLASCYVIPGKAPERYYLLTANGRLTDDLVTLGRAIADYH